MIHAGELCIPRPGLMLAARRGRHGPGVYLLSSSRMLNTYFYDYSA